MMTNEDRKKFKSLFSAYCRKEQNQGHCSGTECSYCPIEIAYREAFPDISEDIEDLLCDSLEDWDVVDSEDPNGGPIGSYMLQDPETGERIKMITVMDADTEIDAEPYAKAKEIMDTLEEALEDSEFDIERINDWTLRCCKKCSSFDLFCTAE